MILSFPQIPKWKPDYVAPVKVLIYLWEGGKSDPYLPMLPFPCIQKWAGIVPNKNQDLLFKLGFYIVSVSLDLDFFIYMSWRLFSNNEQSFHSFPKYCILFPYVNSQ